MEEVKKYENKNIYFWTNNKFPGDEAYKTSSQPAIVYEALIDMDKMTDFYVLEIIGHSHYSGKNGQLYENIETITSAKKIVDIVKVKVLR